MSTDVKTTDDTSTDDGSNRRGITLEQLAIAFVVLAGFLANATKISDNTMLLHLRTGMQMYQTHSIPRHDPYSFTAAGDPWVVESWLAEWTYGALHALGGWHLVIFQQMVMTACLALFVALVARGGSMIRTAICCVIALTIGLPEWSARPALYGSLFFAATVYIIDRKKSPYWLLPIGWLWVNTHGSFPLGIGWIALAAFGAFCDDRSSARSYVKPGGLFVGGILLGAINPLGIQLLLFSLRVFGSKRSSFAAITEWRSPDFHDPVGIAQLCALGIAILFIARNRIAWRYTIPFAVFLIASLFSRRNLAFFAIALVPAVRASLQQVKFFGSVSYASKLFVGVSAVALCLGFVGSTLYVTRSDALDLRSYPTTALAFMQQDGLLSPSHRIATQDFVGCYRIFRDGSSSKVFLDDRYDMYPSQVVVDYLDLLEGTANPDMLLDKYNIDVVLWQKKEPLAFDLQNEETWRQVYIDKDWVVLVRIG